MKKRYWLRGLAVGVGISGLSGFSSMSLYAQQNSGLQLSSYPYSTVAHTSGPINIGSRSYPSLAQNTPTGGHVHVPEGTYTNLDQGGPLHMQTRRVCRKSRRFRRYKVRLRCIRSRLRFQPTLLPCTRFLLKQSIKPVRHRRSTRRPRNRFRCPIAILLRWGRSTRV